MNSEAEDNRLPDGYFLARSSNVIPYCRRWLAEGRITKAMDRTSSAASCIGSSELVSIDLDAWAGRRRAGATELVSCQVEHPKHPKIPHRLSSTTIPFTCKAFEEPALNLLSYTCIQRHVFALGTAALRECNPEEIFSPVIGSSPDLLPDSPFSAHPMQRTTASQHLHGPTRTTTVYFPELCRQLPRCR